MKKLVSATILSLIALNGAALAGAESRLVSTDTVIQSQSIDDSIHVTNTYVSTGIEDVELPLIKGMHEMPEVGGDIQVPDFLFELLELPELPGLPDLNWDVHLPETDLNLEIPSSPSLPESPEILR